MHKNDLSAKIDLVTLNDSINIYALGALDNLKGEILIWDGEPFISIEKDSTVIIDKSLDHEAALLVYSSVGEWKAIEVPHFTKTLDDLRVFIRHNGAVSRLDTNAPFPFLLSGMVESLDWHVINWPDGDSVHTHEKHQMLGAHGTLANQQVDILGFYSENHAGVFTHHSTPLHMHFKTPDGLLAGHIDHFKPSVGMTLYLPKTDH